LPENISNVVNLDLTPVKAMQVIAEIVKDTSNVIITDHAQEKMIERGITAVQILKCLKNGRIIEGPYRETRGNWKMNINCFSAGEPLTVVVVLDNQGNGNLTIVITAYNG